MLDPQNIDLKVVLARYQEDISWTKNLKYPFVVYNKGPTIPGVSTIKICERGREAYSYLQHIVREYDRLNEYTVFSQANPFDHSADFINRVNNFDGSITSLWLSDNVIREGILENSGLHRVFKELFHDEILDAHTTIFPAAQIFIVHKILIHFRSREFYQKIIDIADNPENYSHLDIGDFSGVLERLWPIIFNKTFVARI